MRFYLLILVMCFSVVANADLLHIARKPLSGGFVVFELYDETARPYACAGHARAVAKLEKNGKQYPYGEGCWIPQEDGWITFAIDAGGRLLHQSRVHRSEFEWVAVGRSK